MTGEEHQVKRLGRVVLYPYAFLGEVVEGENLPRYDLRSVGDGEAEVIGELRAEDNWGVAPISSGR